MFPRSGEQALDEQALVKVLTEPKNCLVSQYKTLFKLDGVELVLDEAAVKAVARQAIDRGTGARGLRSIVVSAVLSCCYLHVPPHSPGGYDDADRRAGMIPSYDWTTFFAMLS